MQKSPSSDSVTLSCIQLALSSIPVSFINVLKGTYTYIYIYYCHLYYKNTWNYFL